MSVKLIIDSTANINENLKNEFTIVPLTVNFGENEYVDGVTITNNQFYEMLKTSSVMPTTSQATPEAFMNVYKEIVENGDEAVVITISSKLSGTYQSACIGAMDYEDKVYVIDSKSATIGAGVLAQYAVELKNQGKSAKEIADILTQERENVCIFGYLDTLEYLKRGGRISKTAALAGGILSMKPILCISDGEIKSVAKARGLKQAESAFTQEIEKKGKIDTDKPILFGYTGTDDANLKAYLEDYADFWKDKTEDNVIAQVGSVVGTHTGPGTVLAAFFIKE